MDHRQRTGNGGVLVERVRPQTSLVELAGQPSEGPARGRTPANNPLVAPFVAAVNETTGTLGFFGCSQLACEIVRALDGRSVAYIIDNDPAKQGTHFDGVEIVSFEHAQRRPPDVLVISSTTSEHAMRRQIEAHPAFGATRLISTRSLPLIDLSGDRDVEYAWISANMPLGPGRALDFGCGFGHLGLAAAQRGFTVTALDLREIEWPYAHPGLEFTQKDLLELGRTEERFDLIINCSTVEHVGLAGRYGSPECPDGDLEAMQWLLQLAQVGGTMLLTVPVGRDTVFRPLHRVYGRERLPRLLAGWTVVEKQFWTKSDTNKWGMVGQDEALAFEPTQSVYGLGCFVLRRPVNTRNAFKKGPNDAS